MAGAPGHQSGCPGWGADLRLKPGAAGCASRVALTQRSDGMTARKAGGLCRAATVCTPERFAAVAVPLQQSAVARSMRPAHRSSPPRRVRAILDTGHLPRDGAQHVTGQETRDIAAEPFNGAGVGPGPSGRLEPGELPRGRPRTLGPIRSARRRRSGARADGSHAPAWAVVGALAVRNHSAVAGGGSIERVSPLRLCHRGQPAISYRHGTRPSTGGSWRVSG